MNPTWPFCREKEDVTSEREKQLNLIFYGPVWKNSLIKCL